jgi:hypothetical protein
MLLLPELPILKLFCLLVFLQVRNPKISPIIKLIILAQLPKSDKSIISSNYIIDFSLNFSFLNFGKLHQENKTLVKDNANNSVDQIINSKIDECHDHAKFNSKELLEKLKEIVQDNFDDIHDKTKYRL